MGVKLLPQNTLKFGKDEGRQKKGDRSVAHPGQNLIRFAVWKRQGRNQDIGVHNDPHALAGSGAQGMDEVVHVVFGANTQGLGAGRGLALQLLPASFL